MCQDRQESKEIPTTEATRELRVIRAGDKISVALFDIEGRLLDVVPAIMGPASAVRQTGERAAAA